MKTALCIASVPLTVVVAFAPQANNNVDVANMIALNAEAFSVPSPSKPIFDPLGLYPQDSPERAAGLIEPLESSFAVRGDKDVLDPLRLYQADANSLYWQRRAEIKHARLAMLASAGWLSAELLHGPIARALDLPAMLASGDRVPSILNDGLSHAAFPAFWIATIALAAVVEIGESVEEKSLVGRWDAGFDPLRLGGKTKKQQFFMQEAELFYGRLGMLAITGFAFQEFFLHSAVVDQMPFELMREMML